MIKMNEDKVKERITEVLKKHPEGLTILNIAASIGINRVTASKYVFCLVAEGIVSQRRVGAAKLCYLRLRA